MTDTEKKFKSAFMTLLDDYRNNIAYWTNHENNYCARYCPFAHSFDDESTCPAIEQCEEDEDDYDIDEDKCREAIFNWYMENSND